MLKPKTAIGAVSLLAAAIAASAASYHALAPRFERDSGLRARVGAGLGAVPTTHAGGAQSGAAASSGGGVFVAAPVADAASPAGRGTYIVVFQEEALASYKGDRFGLPALLR